MLLSHFIACLSCIGLLGVCWTLLRCEQFQPLHGVSAFGTSACSHQKPWIGNHHLSGVPLHRCCAVVPNPATSRKGQHAQMPPLCQPHSLKNPWIFLQKSYPVRKFKSVLLSSLVEWQKYGKHEMDMSENGAYVYIYIYIYIYIHIYIYTVYIPRMHNIDRENDDSPWN